MMTFDETLRRWAPIVARIKTRLAAGNGSTPPKLKAAIDEAAATYDELLQESARHLQRENAPLTYFVHDRQPFFAMLSALATAGEVQATLLMRPRERALMMIDAFAIPRLADDESEALWLWFLVPNLPQGTEKRSGRDMAAPLPA